MSGDSEWPALVDDFRTFPLEPDGAWIRSQPRRPFLQVVFRNGRIPECRSPKPLLGNRYHVRLLPSSVGGQGRVSPKRGVGDCDHVQEQIIHLPPN